MNYGVEAQNNKCEELDRKISLEVSKRKLQEEKKIGP